MIKIIVNDLKITHKEITKLLNNMNKSKDYNASKIFCYPIRTIKKRKKMINHSTFITARCKQTNELVGLIRIIGDSTYEYYFSEVMVIPSMQSKGIGTRLIKKAINYCKKNDYMQIFLSSAKGKESFYNKFGFKPCKLTIMKIKNLKLEE